MPLGTRQNCPCCDLRGTRQHFMPLRWMFPALRCRDHAGSSLAKSLFTVLCSPLHKSPLYFKQTDGFNIISLLEVASQSRTSSYLVTSGRCGPSAADEKWYSPKRPSSTVAIQHAKLKHLRQTSLLDYTTVCHSLLLHRATCISITF